VRTLSTVKVNKQVARRSNSYQINFHARARITQPLVPSSARQSVANGERREKRKRNRELETGKRMTLSRQDEQRGNREARISSERIMNAKGDKTESVRTKKLSLLLRVYFRYSKEPSLLLIYCSSRVIIIMMLWQLQTTFLIK